MECICGLAAAVTDLLQSVTLEYHGYEGDVKDSDKGTNKGASQQDVTDRLNELFSLVQGLGGTAVVRTYIDQLAQVLSALVGWSKIEKCWGGKGKCDHGKNGSDCEYLKDKAPENKCDSCGCMKWDVPRAGENKGHHLGRGCTRCKGNGEPHECQCGPGGDCKDPGKECKCAKKGKCCKCCCNGQCNNCKKECRCDKEDEHAKDEYTKESYMSAYPSKAFLKGSSYFESIKIEKSPSWKNLDYLPPDKLTNNGGTITERRHQCARILLGSVCLIWSGITYMYWTGKWAESSPRWNNHILDGSGLDDGSLSQWLQALGFPKAMLNNHGPGNRLDAVIWDGFKEKFYLGFPDTSTDKGHGNDKEGNTFRDPSSMNFAGYIHTLEKGAFGDSVFKGNGSVPDQHKLGPLYKLYILSCAYFTGLQKKTPPKAENITPRTIREILYWLSALPYSKAYKGLLDHCNSALEKASPTDKKLLFYQEKRWAPITVHEYNLFAHFQAVTQYCPLVLIGIQGGIHSTNNTTPAIHSLYANTECKFTYPTVSIQAYNQVVHYIRALFYQLYFLRKQCAVKVTCGGKWRECRYGDGVLGKGVISWMCLGCDPMEHDRKSRVRKVKEELVGVMKKVEGKKEDESEEDDDDEEDVQDIAQELKTLLEAIGQVVIQLGNAQEALEGKAESKVIEGVKVALSKVKQELERAVKKVKDGLNGKELDEAKKALGELTNGGGALGELAGDRGLSKATNGEYDPGKNKISEAIKGVRDALELLKEGVEKQIKEEAKEAENSLKTFFNITKADKELESVLKQELSYDYTTLLNAINDLTSLCNSPKCSACDKHSEKCGRPSNPTICQTCLQPTTTGVPSPLQAFLEDRLPGFSCEVVRGIDEDQLDYPLAASHLGHCGGSGQCCPLPMGFRNQFYKGSTSDSIGARLYGILYFFSNGDMMQSCVYTLVRVTAELSATTPQVLGDVFGFFRGGVGNPVDGKGEQQKRCDHNSNPSTKPNDYFCGWCASGLREEVKGIQWIPNGTEVGGKYRGTVGEALIQIKGDKDSDAALKSGATTTTSLSALTENCQYLSPLTGELYTAVSATFGGTYLSWVLYLSDALEGGLKSLSEAFRNVECRGCKGQCDPNKCKKGSHGQGSGPCQCQSIVSCTGVLPVLYRHGFSYGNPFNLEGYTQKDKDKDGQYDIMKAGSTKRCHEFLESLNKVLEDEKGASKEHPLTNLLSQVGKLQYDIRLPWIFVLTIAWLVAVLYLAFGAIWPLDWTHMRSHWLRGGEHQWQCMWYKVMTGRKGRPVLEGVTFHTTMM